MVIKHAAELAQIVEASKQQAPLFAQQAQQTIQAGAQVHASPTSNSILAPAQQLQQQPEQTNITAVNTADGDQTSISLDSHAAAAPQLPGSSANILADSSGAAAEHNSNIQAQHAQQPGSSLTGQAQHAQQLAAKAAVPAVQLPAIQRRVVKPITMARGSSAFLLKRPAPAVPAAPSTSMASGLAPSKTVSTQKDLRQQQQQAPASTSTLLSSTVSAPVVLEAPSALPAASTAASVAQADRSQAESAADQQQQPGSSTNLSQGSQPAAAASAPSGLASAPGGAMTKPVKLQPQIKLAGGGLFGKSAGAAIKAPPQPNQASSATHACRTHGDV